jgi:hypothetical protein
MPRALLLVILLLTAPLSFAATDEQAVTAADARFWQAYDRCDMESISDLLTEDVEFYHDQTGLTASRSAVVASLRAGPCGNRTFKLRREFVSGSLSSTRWQAVMHFCPANIVLM